MRNIRYLLDTNVISELIKLPPNKHVMKWLHSTGLNNCYISVITLGEISKGVAKLHDSHSRDVILQWLEEELPQQFEGRILDIDASISNKWGDLVSVNKTPEMDAFIAASALVHGITLVTRNTKDFQNIEDLELVNPWHVSHYDNHADV